MRFLLGIVTLAGMFAQNPVTVKAGDRAPDLDWSSVVHPPDGAQAQPGLTGLYTVITFLPITPNPKAINRWNELVAKFSDKPVQFIWVATESRLSVEPSLKEHPINSWVIVDEKRDMARAYGGDLGGNPIIDPSGNIVGFTPAIADPDTLSAVLEGRAVAMPRDTDDEQVWKLLGGLTSGKVRIGSEPDVFPRSAQPVKPDVAPSWEVHITHSKTKGTEVSAGPDFAVQRGFGLRAIIATVYGREENRVELPPALDNDDKFDFEVVLPKEESGEIIHQMLRQAIETRFAISPVVETRPTDVYVMTATEGQSPRAKTGPESFGGGFASSQGFQFAIPPGTPETPEAIQKAIEEMMKHPEARGLANVSTDNTTMEDLGRILEMGLGRPVINETGLEGVYDIEVNGDAGNTGEFIRRLREQAGLTLTPATRPVEVLVMRSRR